MAVDTTACYRDGAVENCSCTREMKHLLPTYSNDSMLLRSEALSPFSTVTPTCLEKTSGTAAFINLLTIFQDFNFGAQLFQIQVKSIARC